MRLVGAWLLVVAACGAQTSQPNSVELPQQLPAPVATVSGELPQKHDPPPQARSAHRWTPPTPKQPPDVSQARQYFVRGVKEYTAGNYAQAITEFETAYSYSPHDAVLFNIATALERVNRVDEAIDVYGRYADTHPPNEAEVRRKIDELRK